MGDYRGRVPGACVLVLHQGKPVIRGAFGMADLEQETATTTATNYRLASVTKQFTAAAVLMLMEEGALSLDAPAAQVASIAPGARGRRDSSSTADSYFRHHRLRGSRPGRPRRAIAGRRRAAGCSNPNRAPTSRREAPTATATAAMRCWRCRGKSLGEALRDVSAGTHFRAARDERHGRASGRRLEGAHRAYGYSWIDGGWQRTDQNLTSAVLGDGGVYSSIDDLAKWDAALYDGRLLRPESLAARVHAGNGHRRSGHAVWLRVADHR